MSKTEEMLEDYLLCNEKLPVDDQPENKNVWPWNLHDYLILDENWKIFFDLSFDAPQLKICFTSLTEEEKRQTFRFGISCLVSFVQCNFTGPHFVKNVEDFLSEERFASSEFIKTLSVNNEEININTRFPILLVVAKIIFEWLLIDHVVNCWWYWRAILIHQHILDELSPTLLSEADRLYKQLQGVDNLPNIVKVSLDIEIVQLYVVFRHIPKIKKHVLSAGSLLGVKYDFVGVLGKRTKYQETDIAQLSIKVTIEKGKQNVTSIEDAEATEKVPINVPLNDDVRLNAVAFLEDGNKDIVLNNLEQKLFITMVQEMLITKPRDELQEEELQPFINLILNQKNTYAVRVVALLLRCRLESNNRRTIERCLGQCEEIINSIKRKDPLFLYRVQDIFSTGLPPIWKTEAQYADLLLNIGLVKNALDIYLKLKIWEGVIVCYTILKLRHKAAEVIKEQLEIKPTVKLWCLLGDATDDVSCYKKAWEMSKRRSSKAQRHWGQYLFSCKQYEECIPHLEKSVSINPLQPTVWFQLGYAALQTENWQTAATAYRRYTTIEPESFEAWNNLAQAYIKIGNKRNAHQALLEALKCNFENWKVWENLLLVSCDISHFSDVIRAYHKLLDLKENYMNVEALNMLVHNVANDLADHEGLPASRHLQKTKELLGRVTSRQPTSGAAWELYAVLAPSGSSGMRLRAHRLQRALIAYTRRSGWETNMETRRVAVRACCRLAECVLEEEGGVEPKDSLVESIVMNLTSTLAAVEKMEQKINDKESQVEQLATRLKKVIGKMKTSDAPIRQS